MDTRLYILSLLHETFSRADLNDSTWRGLPSWNDGQLFRAWTLRLERGDHSAWQEFLEQLRRSKDLTDIVRDQLAKRSLFAEDEEWRPLLHLPPEVAPFSKSDEEEFLALLDRYERDQARFALPITAIVPFRSKENVNKFIPPRISSVSEIMYIEMKPDAGLAGPARIGRVTFSKTRRTIYYKGRKFQSLKGIGFKANYFDVESGMWYWISKCKQKGNDTLYGGVFIEIDEDVREEYWTEIRKQPESKHITRFRTTGKYSKRRPS
jgi:hypothetical protein